MTTTEKDFRDAIWTETGRGPDVQRVPPLLSLLARESIEELPQLTSYLRGPGNPFPGPRSSSPAPSGSASSFTHAA